MEFRIAIGIQWGIQTGRERQALAVGYLASADGADYGKPRLQPVGEH